jgi:hypothetical protein
VRHAVDIVPALGCEGVDDQRRAHHEAHLALGHAGLELVDHVLRDDVALCDIDAVNTPGKPRRTAAAACAKGQAEQGEDR